MYFSRTGINSFSFFSWFPQLVLKANKSNKQPKTHDYSRWVWGTDYVFEARQEGIEGYMTGIGKGVKSRDYIILQQGCESYKYQVEEIDYYSEPADMWIALLKQVGVN